MNQAKQRPANRKGVFLSTFDIRPMTIDEILKECGDPSVKGQNARFGETEEVVTKLWSPQALADEIHHTSQAAMLSEVNIEICRDSSGKVHIEDGNRTILALKILRTEFGVEPVKVVTVGVVDEREVRYTHEKNYGVQFPVKDYGVLTDDQRAELRLKRQRARKDLSLADYYHAAMVLLESFPGEMPEKVFVKRIGAETIKRYYPEALEGPDEKGDYKIKNRQGPIQDPKRLMKLPRFVRDRFLAGLAGLGPKIPAKKLTTLLTNWEADEEAANGKLTTEMTSDEIEAILPESELLNTLEQVAKASKGGKTGVGVYSAKELDGFINFSKGSRIVSTIAKFLARKRKHTHESVGAAILKIAIKAEQALSPEDWAELDEALNVSATEEAAQGSKPAASDEGSDEAE